MLDIKCSKNNVHKHYISQWRDKAMAGTKHS